MFKGGPTCPFTDSFGDRCPAKPPMGDVYCHEHQVVACSVCGGQATGNCGQQGSIGGPCGFPVCGKKRCRDAHLEKWHPE